MVRNIKAFQWGRSKKNRSKTKKQERKYVDFGNQREAEEAVQKWLKASSAAATEPMSADFSRGMVPGMMQYSSSKPAFEHYQPVGKSSEKLYEVDRGVSWKGKEILRDRLLIQNHGLKTFAARHQSGMPPSPSTPQGPQFEIMTTQETFVDFRDDYGDQHKFATRKQSSVASSSAMSPKRQLETRMAEESPVDFWDCIGDDDKYMIEQQSNIPSSDMLPHQGILRNKTRKEKHVWFIDRKQNKMSSSSTARSKGIRFEDQIPKENLFDCRETSDSFRDESGGEKFSGIFDDCQRTVPEDNASMADSKSMSSKDRKTYVSSKYFEKPSDYCGTHSSSIDKEAERTSDLSEDFQNIMLASGISSSGSSNTTNSKERIDKHGSKNEGRGEAENKCNHLLVRPAFEKIGPERQKKRPYASSDENSDSEMKRRPTKVRRLVEAFQSKLHVSIGSRVGGESSTGSSTGSNSKKSHEGNNAKDNLINENGDASLPRLNTSSSDGSKSKKKNRGKTAFGNSKNKTNDAPLPQLPTSSSGGSNSRKSLEGKRLVDAALSQLSASSSHGSSKELSSSSSSSSKQKKGRKSNRQGSSRKTLLRAKMGLYEAECSAYKPKRPSYDSGGLASDSKASNESTVEYWPSHFDACAQTCEVLHPSSTGSL